MPDEVEVKAAPVAPATKAPATAKPKAARKPAAKKTAKKAVKSAAKPAAAKKAVAKKAAAKPAAKKPVAKKAVAKKAVAKKAVKAVKAVKAAPKPAAKPTKKPNVKPAGKAAKPVVTKEKAKKAKLVRDSFTMPEAEYQVLSDVKKAFLKVGVSVKKSELLRASIALIKNMDTAHLNAVIAALAPIKAGRPKKDK